MDVKGHSTCSFPGSVNKYLASPLCARLVPGTRITVGYIVYIRKSGRLFLPSRSSQCNGKDEQKKSQIKYVITKYVKGHGKEYRIKMSVSASGCRKREMGSFCSMGIKFLFCKVNTF